MLHLIREGIKGDGETFGKFININMFAALLILSLKKFVV